MRDSVFYRLLFVLFLFLWMVRASGASCCLTDSTGVVCDPRLDQLVMKHIQINQKLKTIDGFRIQLFSDSGANSKARAQAVVDEFQIKYPGTGVYLSFKSPNYKVRIGDFRSKLDAQRFLNEISIDYPNAFIVADPVNIPTTE
jgi:hypothetical protein